jgi:hypothetical protein
MHPSKFHLGIDHSPVCATELPCAISILGSDPYMHLGPVLPHGKHSYTFKPSRRLGPMCLDDCALTGHDPAKMPDTWLTARHVSGTSRASGEVGRQDNTV